MAVFAWIRWQLSHRNQWQRSAEYAADAAPGADGATCPLRPSLVMHPCPTFRLTFRDFQKAYPEGSVFVNKSLSNPILYLFVLVSKMVFSASIERQHREVKLVMDDMTHYDDCLPKKTFVWRVNLGD